MHNAHLPLPLPYPLRGLRALGDFGGLGMGAGLLNSLQTQSGGCDQRLDVDLPHCSLTLSPSPSPSLPSALDLLALHLGLLRYANNTHYRGETIIRKQVYVSRAVLQELKRILADSEITREDGNMWPKPERSGGKQELDIEMDGVRKSFNVSVIGKLSDVDNSNDAEGLKIFFYLVQDLKAFVYSLISMHFKINPIPQQLGQA
ncbi:mago nashi protein [Capsaspora owczarzaki ATCC 30864]|uniref:Mago nashi protein n=1 Tax=Capsaspora owczarzaki (strain ATCC 30864) TaxID=595528 RepID=A0A0D2VSG3_CAPO3|nr:mago nashi protein [Capsaspora owczarzaki ATCC 30864]